VKPLFSFRSFIVAVLSWSALGLMFSCNKENDFSITPEIAPKSVTTRDSMPVGGAKIVKVYVTISWKDGDGDLGFLTSDSTHPEDVNYFIVLYKLKGGQFVRIDPPVGSSTGFNGRFPNMNPEGGNSTKAFKLRGDLRYDLKAPGLTVFPASASIIGTVNGVDERVQKGDVLRFTVQIKDRAGHLSNVVTTEQVTL
jgi:hypothetical protein